MIKLKREKKKEIIDKPLKKARDLDQEIQSTIEKQNHTNLAKQTEILCLRTRLLQDDLQELDN